MWLKKNVQFAVSWLLQEDAAGRLKMSSMDNARRLVALQLALHAFRRTVRVQLQRHQRVTLACCHEAAVVWVCRIILQPLKTPSPLTLSLFVVSSDCILVLVAAAARLLLSKHSSWVNSEISDASTLLFVAKMHQIAYKKNSKMIQGHKLSI